MKILTLTQPWATLVAIGAKKIETRSWGTAHRGDLGIHAAKSWTAEDRELCFEGAFGEALIAAGYHGPLDLPLGAIIAVADLSHCGRIHRNISEVWMDGIDGFINGDELEFGNYEAGRYGLHLPTVRRLAEPIPARGMLGLWEWPPPAEGLRYAR